METDYCREAGNFGEVWQRVTGKSTKAEPFCYQKLLYPRRKSCRVCRAPFAFGYKFNKRES